MRAGLVSLLLLAACSKPTPVDNAAVDINAAADRARGDIATYAANSPPPGEITDDNAAAPRPAVANEDAPLIPAEPGQPGGLPDDRTPVAEGPKRSDSPQAAASVVERYYAALEGGHYRQAWALWGNSGADSKMSADMFAASFAKYREYHANIGGPGEVEGVAGSRYVSVPVQVYARLKSGRPDYQTGAVVLRRTEVDGATDDQRKWHIYTIDLKPAPGGRQAAASGSTDTSGISPAATARYRCMDGSRLTVRFDDRANSAAISASGKAIATLRGQRPASGIWYKSARYELRGKGDQATFIAPGKPPIACTAIR